MLAINVKFLSNRPNIENFRLFVLLLVVSFACCNVAVADYLDDLSIEAESTAKVPSAVPNKEKRAGIPNLDMNKMESLLQGSRPSIYLFYSRLGITAKNQIFKSYKADKSSSHKQLIHLQKNVLNHYLEK